MKKHIHIDAVGGVAGDMFVAAAIDLLPELESKLPALLVAAGFPKLVQLTVKSYTDGILCGKQFDVSAIATEHHHHQNIDNYEHSHDHVDGHEHQHRSWSDIRQKIEESSLDNNVKKHAIGIFSCLAAAEAQVHGTRIEDVAFHEVGQWDSIADIICAALAIDSLQATWSVSSLPLGRGHIDSAHGELPLPSPATVLLLKGFVCHDDGRLGERITPTGAAILKYLQPRWEFPNNIITVDAVGQGFGHRTLSGISNVLRLMSFKQQEQLELPLIEDEVARLTFEIDDQTAEELALAMETFRQVPGVLDVLHSWALGKKGRSTFQLQLLVIPQQEAKVIKLCFQHTTTLGIRRQQVKRVILARHSINFLHEDRLVRVKVAERSRGEYSAKVEADDLKLLGSSASERQRWQLHYQELALQRYRQEEK